MILFLFIFSLLVLFNDISIVVMLISSHSDMILILQSIKDFLFTIVTLMFLWYIAGVLDNTNDVLQKFVIGILRRNKGKTVEDLKKE